MKVHKLHEGKTLCGLPTYMNAPREGIVGGSVQRWTRVTCKRCLKKKSNGNNKCMCKANDPYCVNCWGF
jgi:hypothetical protein